MARSEGQPTGYRDRCGKPILFGAKVQLDGLYFTVEENPFNGLLVIDGDTGQEYLNNVYSRCVVAPTELEYYEVFDKVFELRNKFIAKKAILPNRAYLGANLMEMLKGYHKQQVHFLDHAPAAFARMWMIYNLQIVEVTENDHISVGLVVD